jgi:hypothetical protein
MCRARTLHPLPLAAVIAVALLITSCGTEPTGVGGRTDDLNGSLSSLATSSVISVSAPKTGQVITTSKKVSRLLGGTLTAGRHTLVIPPGALSKDTIITLKDVTGVMGRVECEALPEGLKFRLPATLITRFSDLTMVDGHAIYCVVNEGTASEQWVYVGSQVIVGNLGVSALLQHFSRYAPGKAGW